MVPKVWYCCYKYPKYVALAEQLGDYKIHIIY